MTHFIVGPNENINKDLLKAGFYFFDFNRKRQIYSKHPGCVKQKSLYKTGNRQQKEQKTLIFHILSINIYIIIFSYYT